MHNWEIVKDPAVYMPQPYEIERLSGQNGVVQSITSGGTNGCGGAASFFFTSKMAFCLFRSVWLCFSERYSDYICLWFEMSVFMYTLPHIWGLSCCIKYIFLLCFYENRRKWSNLFQLYLKHIICCLPVKDQFQSIYYSPFPLTLLILIKAGNQACSVPEETHLTPNHSLTPYLIQQEIFSFSHCENISIILRTLSPLLHEHITALNFPLCNNVYTLYTNLVGLWLQMQNLSADGFTFMWCKMSRS